MLHSTVEPPLGPTAATPPPPIGSGLCRPRARLSDICGEAGEGAEQGRRRRSPARRARGAHEQHERARGAARRDWRAPVDARHHAVAHTAHRHAIARVALDGGASARPHRLHAHLTLRCVPLGVSFRLASPSAWRLLPLGVLLLLFRWRDGCVACGGPCGQLTCFMACGGPCGQLTCLRARVCVERLGERHAASMDKNAVAFWYIYCSDKIARTSYGQVL
jgi:hypothetical protein